MTCGTYTQQKGPAINFNPQDAAAAAGLPVSNCQIIKPLTRQPLQVHLAIGTADGFGNRERQLRCDSTARLQESNEWDRLFTLQLGSEYHWGAESYARSCACRD